jgi:hypothetical protein
LVNSYARPHAPPRAPQVTRYFKRSYEHKSGMDDERMLHELDSDLQQEASLVVQTPCVQLNSGV